MGQFMYLMFSFLSPKEHNFQKTKISQKDRKKPNLSELTQILRDLLSLLSKYF